MIQIFETEEKPFFVVKGEKLLQVDDYVLIEYLDDAVKTGTVVSSQASSLAGNYVIIEYNDEGEGTDHFEYELIG